MNVRSAEPQDAYTIRDLGAELALLVADPPEAVRLEAALENVFGPDRWCEFLVVESDGGDVVAFATLSRYYEIHTNERRLCLADFIVRSDKRQMGVATALLTAILDRARSLGCTAVTGELWNENYGALAFYLEAGGYISEAVSVFRFSVDAGH